MQIHTGNYFLKYSDGSIFKALPVIPHEMHWFLSFLTRLFAHRKLQQHRFVIKCFPQTLYLNTKFSSAALGGKYRMSVQQLFFFKQWSKIEKFYSLSQSKYFHMHKENSRKSCLITCNKFKPKLPLFPKSSNILVLYLYLFHGQYLPIEHHFLIYSECNFPFLSVNANDEKKVYHGAGTLKVLNK